MIGRRRRLAGELWARRSTIGRRPGKCDGTDARKTSSGRAEGGQKAANDGRGSVPSGSGGSGGQGDGGAGGLMAPGSGAVRNGSAASDGSSGSFGSQELSSGGVSS